MRQVDKNTGQLRYNITLSRKELKSIMNLA